MARSSTQRIDCDVAIAGYGPVGSVLASLLERAGLSVHVFERDREVYKLPRAVHFDHEVMRVFQGIGLSEDLLPETAPILGYEFRNADRELLFGFDIAQQTTRSGWRGDYMFHQPSLEAALRDLNAKRSGVEVHLETEVQRISERDDAVDLEVRDVNSGETRQLTARYLVGCDGGNSFVRKHAGLGLVDLQFDEPWLVVDATVKKPPSELGLPTVPLQLCDPARPTTFIPVAGPYIRWEFMLRPGERNEMLEPDRLRELIAKWADPDEVDIIRGAVYDFHALVAERWNTRRIFLAGDSAHQTPPFLGQGLCAGVRDAANLSWKLAAVLGGVASEEILSSYQSERAPNVTAVIQVAIDMGRIICTQDPEAARARDASWLERESRELPSPDFPRPGPGLWGDSPEAGRLGIQRRVRGPDGASALLDDVTGPGFVLITRGGDVPALSAAANSVRDRLAVSLVPISGEFDVDGEYATWLDEAACDSVLVRPDHYVFGTASGADAASTLLESLGDALGAPSS